MIENLNLEAFNEKIIDFETNTFQGELPCIVKYSASWCSPCRALTPILEKLSEEYNSKINIYEIDVEEEIELSSKFNIRSIPTMMFYKNNEPKIISGLISEFKLKELIEESLL